MTHDLRWLTTASDPLAQLIVDHPTLAACDQIVVISQTAALVHWPTIETSAGAVSIILRRNGAGDQGEWRDQLVLLQQLIAQSGKDVQFLALTKDAAAELSEELLEPVSPIRPMPRAFQGSRKLKLSRAGGPLEIIHGPSKALTARQFHLARLRRMAFLETDGTDADLADIVHFANGVPDPSLKPPRSQPVVIVVVPNGFGLGHVTRMLAVARHLRAKYDARIVFWSFSRAVGIIAKFGFEVISRHTARHIGADTDDWRKWETAEFAAVLAQLDPDLVVQDAARLEDFIVDALAMPGAGCARVALVRRGMWQKHILGADAFTAENVADAVLEPGDLATSADRGITRGRAQKRDTFAIMDVSAPITLTKPTELLDQKRARKTLGLGRGRHCLITLGGDAFSDWNHLVRQLIDAAAQQRVQLVWARSPLAAPDIDITTNLRITSKSLYPLAPYLSAFDGVVSSAGYNSFHELMQLYDRPVLFAPRQHSALDDQAARAAFAASRGWASNVEASPDDLQRVSAFMQDVRAARTVKERPKWHDGAAQLADMLMDLIREGRSEGP